MINNSVKVLCTLVVVALFALPTSAILRPAKQVSSAAIVSADFDPLVDNITVTVSFDEIRALQTIDYLSDPDLFLKVLINGNEFISDVWQDTKYVKNITWSASSNVPKDEEFVNISLQLWDKNNGIDRLCDISPDYGNLTQARTAELTYSIATGVWWGDDYLSDPSGYGRLNGCDDNSIYQADRDCELLFTISQNDFDGDRFPYWLETNMYNTSPLINNRGEDADNDGIPIEWEYTFGLTYIEWGHDTGYYMIYDPFVWENHTSYDDDADGLNNIEEYRTWQWGSDPFRQDIFIELDQMELGPNGEGSSVPVGSFELLRDSYGKHNIYWHIDDGRLGGGELIPFREVLGENDLEQWYMVYFMHGDVNNWRRGVFRWGVITYNSSWAYGFAFGSRVNGVSALDCFSLCSSYHDSRAKHIPLIDSLIRKTFNREEQRAIVYAGAMMHETGHLLDVEAPGADNHGGAWPWNVEFWRYGSYKSVMNYRYIYSDLIDYSDGSHGKNDYDDWATIDLTYFNPRPHWP
jgi:hypothetical protein